MKKSYPFLFTPKGGSAHFRMGAFPAGVFGPIFLVFFGYGWNGA